MKKIVIILTVCLATSLFAAIGSITTLKGKVTIERSNASIDAKLNDKIYRYDIIKTKNDSMARIILEDNTLITIGKDSALNIEDYIYDESDSSKNKANLNFFKGVFKSVTGKIGKINPEKFKLKTKRATIGIRGTTIVGSQEKIMVLEGSVLVTSQNQSVIVNSGFFTNINLNQPPTSPEAFTSKDLDAIIGGLSNKKKEKKSDDEEEGDNTTGASSKASETNNDAQSDNKIPDTDDLISERIHPTKWNDPSTPDSSFSNNTLEGEIVYSTDLANDTFTRDYTINIDFDDGTIVSKILDSDSTEVYTFGNASNSSSYYYIDTDYFGTNSSTGWVQAIPDKLENGIYSSSDNEVSWGYWQNTNSITGDTYKGTWVAGNSVNFVQDISSSVTLNFSGYMIGYTKAVGSTTLNNILYDSNNSFNLSLAIGSGNITGNFAFNTSNNESWSGSFDGTATSGSSFFSTTNITGTGAGNGFSQTKVTPTIRGNIYGSGSEITAVGGSFILGTDSDIAYGSFIGEKK